MSLSPTFGRYEKIEHHIKTHKSILLRFWIGGDVIRLCELDLDLIGIISLLI